MALPGALRGGSGSCCCSLLTGLVLLLLSQEVGPVFPDDPLGAVRIEAAEHVVDLLGIFIPGEDLSGVLVFGDTPAAAGRVDAGRGRLAGRVLGLVAAGGTGVVGRQNAGDGHVVHPARLVSRGHRRHGR